MRSKYGAKKTIYRGNVYDSKLEAKCAMLLSNRSDVHNLRRQVRYELLPKTDAYRAVYYIADFVYTDEDGEEHICDAKGVKTPAYAIKEKLFYYRYGKKIELLK